MFTVCVRAHMMIAHSFRGEVFGPAQKLHGATYVVDAEFHGESLDANGLVVDIGRATTGLEAIMGLYSYQNLDDIEELKGMNTTTEAMAKVVFDKMKAKIEAGELGPGSEGLKSLKIVLRESHAAWAAYEGPL